MIVVVLECLSGDSILGGRTCALLLVAEVENDIDVRVRAEGLNSEAVRGVSVGSDGFEGHHYVAMMEWDDVMSFVKLGLRMQRNLCLLKIKLLRLGKL